MRNAAHYETILYDCRGPADGEGDGGSGCQTPEGVLGALRRGHEDARTQEVCDEHRQGEEWSFHDVRFLVWLALPLLLQVQFEHGEGEQGGNARF